MTTIAEKTRLVIDLNLQVDALETRLADLARTAQQLESHLVAWTADLRRAHYPRNWSDRTAWTDDQLRRAHAESKRGVTTPVVRIGEREWQRRRKCAQRAAS